MVLEVKNAKGKVSQIDKDKYMMLHGNSKKMNLL